MDLHDIAVKYLPKKKGVSCNVVTFFHLFVLIFLTVTTATIVFSVKYIFARGIDIGLRDVNLSI